MNKKLHTEHHLEFLSLTGECTSSSESTLIKIPHRWKYHVATLIVIRPETNEKKGTEGHYPYIALLIAAFVAANFQMETDGNSVMHTAQ